MESATNQISVIKINNGTLEFSASKDTGLGTWIGFLSYALDNFDKVHIIEQQGVPLKNLRTLVDTFVLDDRITFSTYRRLSSSIVLSDYTKFFSPYIKFNKVRIKDQIIPFHSASTSPYKKPMIGLAMYGKKEHVFDDGDLVRNYFPFNRYYSMSEWTSIIKKIRKDFGYDVMTLDNIEEFPMRILAMATMCDAIVCYEGGMAHLAHTLGIPCFILPWKHNENQEPALLGYNKPGVLGGTNSPLYAQAIHLDPRTYFLDSIDELLNWDILEFCGQIEKLRNNEGSNNIIFKEDKTDVCLNLRDNFIQIDTPTMKSAFGIDPILNCFMDNLKHRTIGGIRSLVNILHPE